MKKTVILLLILLCMISGCAKKESPKEEYAAENQNITEEESGKPEKITELTPFSYTFDPHVISKEYLRVFGEEIEPLFYGFCDAVLNGEDTFACPSEPEFHEILAVARVCLPIATYLIEEDDIYVENGRGHIAYRVEKEERMQLIQEFTERVSQLIESAVPYKEDDFIIALELLTAVARKNTVDEETLNGGLENILNVMPYRAITENTGICQEMAGEYIYYLLQCGINATTCSALSRDREFSHMWALVEIEGEYYHADPMMSVDYPNSPAFFGMNDTIRDQYGDFDPEEFTYAESGVFTHEDFVCNSERFKRLWRAESYRILHNERKLELTLFDVYAPETEDEFLY